LNERVRKSPGGPDNVTLAFASDRRRRTQATPAARRTFPDFVNLSRFPPLLPRAILG